jgi:hypothetical protein
MHKMVVAVVHQITEERNLVWHRLAVSLVSMVVQVLHILLNALQVVVVQVR